jgi:hypothetical protein
VLFDDQIHVEQCFATDDMVILLATQPCLCNRASTQRMRHRSLLRRYVL